jgi:hypothetical protein
MKRMGALEIDIVLLKRVKIVSESKNDIHSKKCGGDYSDLYFRTEKDY